MKLLSFDTSSRELTVAVYDGRRLLASHRLDYADEKKPAPPVEAPAEPGIKNKADRLKKKKPVNRQETISKLVPTIDLVVHESGLSKHDLQGICVGIGPGSFTGVRVAVVTARTLAQALDLPLVGVSSLETMALDACERHEISRCGVIMQASPTHVFYAAYAFDISSPDGPALKETLVQPAYGALDLVRQDLDPDLSGPLSSIDLWAVDEKCAGLLDGAEDSRLQKCAWPLNNVAVTQAKLAIDRLSLEKPNYLDVFPLYLRGASVTLKTGDAVQRVESH